MTIDQARRLQFITRWHRRLAIFVMAWLVLLAVSGILVNHAHDWGLDRKALAPPLQRWLYGIEGSAETYCKIFPETGAECSEIFARLPLQSSSLLLSEHSLYLLDESGGLLEKMPVASAGLVRLEAGLSQGKFVYLQGPGKTVRTDPDLLDFQTLSELESGALAGTDWKKRQQQVAAISWERFLLDLHAARFLGPLAKSFNDLAAGLILLLAASGAWLYRLRRRTNGY